MPPNSIDTLAVRDRQEWRRWLEGNHDKSKGVWLVFYRRGTGVTTLSYNDSVEEAICFGWVDSLVKRLDDERYARKFTPRASSSRWSTVNRRRYESLLSRGLLAPAGLQRPPTDRSGDALRPSLEEIPDYIESGLKSRPEAWDNFNKLAPSYKRQYIAWIDSAKREETRQRRLQEALTLLEAGERLGLK